jgi:hypothetical protein
MVLFYYMYYYYYYYCYYYYSFDCQVVVEIGFIIWLGIGWLVGSIDWLVLIG